MLLCVLVDYICINTANGATNRNFIAEPSTVGGTTCTGMRELLWIFTIFGNIYFYSLLTIYC